jgi:hypothetical protein
MKIPAAPFARLDAAIAVPTVEPKWTSALDANQFSIKRPRRVWKPRSMQTRAMTCLTDHFWVLVQSICTAIGNAIGENKKVACVAAFPTPSDAASCSLVPDTELALPPSNNDQPSAALRLSRQWPPCNALQPAKEEEE